MRLVATILVFVALGPLIGGIVFVFAMGNPEVFLFGGLLLFGMSYVIGTVPALVAGLLVAVVQLLRGSVSTPVVFLIGLSTGTGLVLVTTRGRVSDLTDWLNVAMNSACVIATFACWAIARAWLPPKAGAAT